MADVTSSIDEIIDVRTLFNNLAIAFDDTATISDGNVTYNIYAISNLDSDKKDILIEIGFEEFKDGIFLIDGDEIRVREVLEYLLPYYIQKETEQWDEIIEKIVAINDRAILFNPSSKQLKIVSKWKGKLAKNDDEFRILILDLFMLFRESCKQAKERDKIIINEECFSHEFWKDIGDLRNHYSAHDPEQRREGGSKDLQKIQVIFEDLFPSSPTKRTQLDFMNAQFKLFSKCLDFLDIVLSELS